MTRPNRGSLVANSTMDEGSTPKAIRSRWRQQVATKLQTQFKHAIPRGTGVENTAYYVQCRNQTVVNIDKTFGEIVRSSDGRPPALFVQSKSQEVVVLRLIDFLGIGLVNKHFTPDEAIELWHAVMNIGRKALADKPPLAKRRADKAKLYYEWIFDYLCGVPQLPRHKRVRTAKEIAKRCRLELPRVKKTLKILMAEGKVIRDTCQYGDGYAAAWKDT